MQENELPDNIDELKKIIFQIKSLNKGLRNEIETLKEQVSFFKALKFAPKTEKVSKEQMLLFNEAETLSEEPEPEEEKTTVKEHKRVPRGKRRPLPDSLAREIVNIDLPEKEKTCTHDGSALKLIGEEISEKLEIVPAKIKVIRIVRKKYACP